ncbi:MAG: CRISPR-associated endonuclease Cas2, partial [Chloroflexaceae bacterium]|nr:CRISPR-associated endonuclease Cas2 [Chloroflexaceae bacterium]
SLFECWLNKRQIIELRAKLQLLLEPDSDSVRLYMLCGACQRRVITIGSDRPHDPPVHIF